MNLKSESSGILEPKNHLKKVFDFSKPALCIVPGLCFDKDGFRVGYGGGYYDRFLCKFKGLSAGLCYDKNVLKSIDFDEYDVSGRLFGDRKRNKKDKSEGKRWMRGEQKKRRRLR